MAKTFTIPAPLALKNPQGLVYNEPKMKFETFLELAVFDNPKLDNPKGWRWSSKILNICNASTDPKTGAGTAPVVLSDEDWKQLSELLENPQHTQFDQTGQKIPMDGIKGYAPHICRQLLVFIDAVLGATEAE